MIDLPGMQILEAEMRDRLKAKNEEIDRLSAKIEELKAALRVIANHATVPRRVRDFAQRAAEKL